MKKLQGEQLELFKTTDYVGFKPVVWPCLQRLDPETLVSALQDPIHKDIGRSRPARAARKK